jgi:hypothetical protein
VEIPGKPLRDNRVIISAAVENLRQRFPLRPTRPHLTRLVDDRRVGDDFQQGQQLGSDTGPPAPVNACASKSDYLGTLQDKLNRALGKVQTTEQQSKEAVDQAAPKTGGTCHEASLGGHGCRGIRCGNDGGVFRRKYIRNSQLDRECIRLW